MWNNAEQGSQPKLCEPKFSNQVASVLLPCVSSQWIGLATYRTCKRVVVQIQIEECHSLQAVTFTLLLCWHLLLLLGFVHSETRDSGKHY